MSIKSNKLAVPAPPSPSARALEGLRDYLARRGLRLTTQRAAVLNQAFRLGGHFTADELWQHLRRRHKEVSRATVYRTLRHMKAAGFIHEVLQCRGRASYEVVYGHEHHDHMVCVVCGKVIEFSDERIERLQRAICRKHRFSPIEHRLGIRGICRECSAAGKSGGQ